MKKLLQVIIVCGLLGMLLIGCGKSEAVIACEKQAYKFVSDLAKFGEGLAKMEGKEKDFQKDVDQDEIKKKIEQSCSSYEGGASEKEVQKWIMSGGMK
tara:strand:+ start:114 stop:407 length:294 start_codon:yes stop_codon:yes gene_type:complete